MSGRAATSTIVPGRFALSIGDPQTAVPQGWQRVPLLEIADLGTGHTPSRKHPEYWDGKIPWIGLRDAGAHHGGTIIDTLQHVTKLGLENSSARLLPKDTVCLSRTASVGYVVMMGRPMATSQDFVNWSCTGALVPKFLMYALMAEGDDIRRFGEGSTHTTIYFPEVKAFHLSLPPLNEQRRIVAKIESLSAKSKRSRDHLDHMPRLVEKYKQAILAAAFRGELSRDAGRQYGWPDAWDKSTLGQVLTDIRYGTAKKCNYAGGKIGVLRIPNVQSGRISIDDLKSADFTDDEIEKLRLEEGDILVIRSNGSLDLVGRSAVVDGAATGMLFAGYLIRLRLDTDRVLPGFVQLYLGSGHTRAAIERLAKSTSGVNNINSTQLQALPFLRPEIEEQREIVRLVNSAFTWIDRLATQATSARKLIDHLGSAILAKAFRGELVPQDPNDEPASVLLERIRSERANGGESGERRVRRRAGAVTR